MRIDNDFAKWMGTLVALAVVAACATASMQSSWKDPAYTGAPMKKILVVGVARGDGNRRIFEDGFTRALQAGGTAAEPSYVSIPEGGEIAAARLAQAVARTRSDAVLVTRVLRISKNLEVTPGIGAPGFYGRGYGGWYRGAWTAGPPDIHTYDVLTIESTLWNMATDRPMWSGTTEASEPKDAATLTADLAKILIAKMKSDGVI